MPLVVNRIGSTDELGPLRVLTVYRSPVTPMFDLLCGRIVGQGRVTAQKQFLCVKYLLVFILVCQVIVELSL